MSLIIQTNRGDECFICKQIFREGEQKFTHVGGENHDGIHRSCFKIWLDISPTCPFDRAPIDPNSCLSRTERIWAAVNYALPVLGIVIGAALVVVGSEEASEDVLEILAEKVMKFALLG